MCHRKGIRARKSLGLLLTAALANLTLAGCFPLQPVEGLPAPESDVRVELTEAAATRISSRTVLPISSVAGRVMRADEDSLVLIVRWREMAATARGRTEAEVVRLGRSDIQSIDARRFSLSRTVLFVAGGALLIAGLLSLAPGTLSPRDDGEPPPPEPR